MGGALLVFVPGYWLVITRRQAPLYEQSYDIPRHKQLDKKLVVGAVMFGIGWGLAGICPGPAVASVGFGSYEIGVFIAAMLAGSLLASRTFSSSDNQTPILINES